MSNCKNLYTENVNVYKITYHNPFQIVVTYLENI